MKINIIAMKPLSFTQSIQEKNNPEKSEKELRSHSKQGAEIVVDPVRITKFLAGSAVLLLIASICANYLTDIDLIRRFGRLMNVDEEKNIPTAFSVFLLQFAATLLATISLLKWEKSPFNAFYWIILSAGFFFMAIDEGWGIHEWFGHLVKPHHGFLLFTWILVFIPVVAVLFLFFLKFLYHLPRRTSRLFLLSGILYIGGAIGFESISAWFFENKGVQSVYYILTVTIEEGLEMSGMVLFIYSLLDYINYRYRQVRVIFHQPGITLKKSLHQK
jgi:hypothetical protein